MYSDYQCLKAFDSLACDELLYNIDNLGEFFSTLKHSQLNPRKRINLIDHLAKVNHHIKTVDHTLSPELFKQFIIDLLTRLNAAGFDINRHYPHLLEDIINHLLWADNLVLLNVVQGDESGYDSVEYEETNEKVKRQVTVYLFLIIYILIINLKIIYTFYSFLIFTSRITETK